MNDYVKPSIEEVDIQIEGVYAASGTIVTPPIEPPKEPYSPENWLTDIKWMSHNSGSHSDVQINLTKTGGSSAKNFEIELTSTFPIKSINSVSGPGNMTYTNTDNSIHIFVNDWTINETQNGNISFQITDKNSQYEGSHYQSNTHLNEKANEFTVVKCESH
ncbi:MAG TPA: hypothetical protein VJY54_13135 [Lachnospiraceae bacterium]|nr:hypothetical protein [Lachnospiraceae bacterium]